MQASGRGEWNQLRSTKCFSWTVLPHFDKAKEGHEINICVKISTWVPRCLWRSSEFTRAGLLTSIFTRDDRVWDNAASIWLVGQKRSKHSLRAPLSYTMHPMEGVELSHSYIRSDRWHSSWGHYRLVWHFYSTIVVCVRTTVYPIEVFSQLAQTYALLREFVSGDKSLFCKNK